MADSWHKWDGNWPLAGRHHCKCGAAWDHDLDTCLSVDQLSKRIEELQDAIRQHRESGFAHHGCTCDEALWASVGDR